MTESAGRQAVYLELGRKRTFAGAIEWPGWCRSAAGEQEALALLLAYAPRYASIPRTAGLDFQIPTPQAAFDVIERLAGTAGTDFGVPERMPSVDSRPVDSAEHGRFEAVLMACWRKFDEVVKSAEGKPLRKGPRGGGREQEEIYQHVLEGEAVYLRRLGWNPDQDAREDMHRMQQVILEALAWSVRGEAPERGPRGGLRWRPRYFVRRVAWHVLDHAWEIEDRLRQD